jgi:hypothetical protein
MTYQEYHQYWRTIKDSLYESHKKELSSVPLRLNSFCFCGADAIAKPEACRAAESLEWELKNIIKKALSED